MAGEVSIVAIVKGEERYVFMFDDDSRAETLRMLGRYASNPELSFSWYDAAVLSQKIRKTRKSTDAPESIPASFDRQLNFEAEEPGDAVSDFDFPSPDDIWISDDPMGQ